MKFSKIIRNIFNFYKYILNEGKLHNQLINEMIMDKNIKKNFNFYRDKLFNLTVDNGSATFGTSVNYILTDQQYFIDNFNESITNLINYVIQQQSNIAKLNLKISNLKKIKNETTFLKKVFNDPEYIKINHQYDENYSKLLDVQENIDYFFTIYFVNYMKVYNIQDI